MRIDDPDLVVNIQDDDSLRVNGHRVVVNSAWIDPVTAAIDYATAHYAKPTRTAMVALVVTPSGRLTLLVDPRGRARILPPMAQAATGRSEPSCAEMCAGGAAR